MKRFLAALLGLALIGIAGHASAQATGGGTACGAGCIVVPNDTGNGTLLNGPAVLFNDTVFSARAAGDPGGSVIGIVIAESVPNCGLTSACKSGNATIVTSGIALCKFDNSTGANPAAWVVVSATTTGTCAGTSSNYLNSNNVPPQGAFGISLINSFNGLAPVNVIPHFTTPPAFVTWQPGQQSSITPLASFAGMFQMPGSTYAKFYISGITGSSSTFTCSGNPTITVYNCGSDPTCGTSPTAMGTVTLTASITGTVGSITSPGITGGQWGAFKATAGTCSSLDPVVNVGY